MQRNLDVTNQTLNRIIYDEMGLVIKARSFLSDCERAGGVPIALDWRSMSEEEVIKVARDFFCFVCLDFLPKNGVLH